jgi:hypothetical protein
MVYWIRRGAIVLIAITVIIALFWLFGALRGGTTSGTQASGSAEPSASSSSAVQPEGSDAPSASASAPVASGDPVDCLDTAIGVEATTDSSTYAVGSTPKLTLTITNTGDVACLRDVGPKANELTITSGGYHVWSSDDCSTNSKSKVSTLKPGQSYVASITWDGHLSQKGCTNSPGAAAKAGRYDLVGRNGKVDSSSTPFALTAG